MGGGDVGVSEERREHASIAVLNCTLAAHAANDAVLAALLFVWFFSPLFFPLFCVCAALMASTLDFGVVSAECTHARTHALVCLQRLKLAQIAFFFFQHCSICVVSCVTIHSKDATHPFCSRPSFQRLSMSAHSSKTILVFSIDF